MVAERLDSVGIGLMSVALLWVLVAAAVSGTNPLPMLATIVITAASLVVARGMAAQGRPAGAVAVVVGAGMLALISFGGAAETALRYENAKGAFYIQAGLAGILVTLAWGSRGPRVAGAVGAAVFAVLAVLTGSRAVLLLLAVLAPLTLIIALARPAILVRVVIALCATAVVGALVSTMLVAGLGGRESGPASRVLSSNRVALWTEALDLMGEHPVFGVGPGGFGSVSRTGRGDRDLQWAHNDFLQQGAETGLPGLALLVLAFLWSFGYLWAAPPDAVTGIAVASLAALGVHAAFDYVLHFPAVVAASAALVGTAQASRTRRRDEATLETLARKTLKVAVLPLGTLRRRSGDVTVLLYHRVGAGGREIDLPAETFEQQMGRLSAANRIRAIDEALGDGSPGGVVVTFDDGSRDFHEHVLSILIKHSVPAVLYLATSLVVEEGGDPADGLSWAHLREAVRSGLVTIGSHTHSHVNLAAATEAEAEEEMRRSQGLVEDRLGVACRHFAYPWGVGSPDAERAVRRLFDSAALPWGTNRAGSLNPYRLARVPVLRSDGYRLFRAKVEGRLDAEAFVYRLLGRGPWRRR